LGHVPKFMPEHSPLFCSVAPCGRRERVSAADKPRRYTTRETALWSEARMATWLTATDARDLDLPSDAGSWDRFRDVVTRAGLAGLILERTAQLEVPWPDRVRVSLQRVAMLVAANNLAIAEETSRLVGVLSEARIPAMLLKGAALNLTVYDRPNLRPMGDADLLVHCGDAERAVHVLLQNGCRSGAPLLRSDFFPKYYYETELTAGTARPVRIDLHARPFRPLCLARTIPDAAFWDSPRVARLGHVEVLIPRPEIMFIHLAAHAAFHGCSRLVWLYDIRRLVERYGSVTDWDEVGRLTCRWRLSPAVSTALTRARTLFGEVCPDALTRTLELHRSDWRDRLTLSHAPRDARAPLAHVAVNVLCAPGWRFKLGYLRAVLLPGRAHLAGMYRRRHVGWATCAHAWRVCRALRRLIPA